MPSTVSPAELRLGFRLRELELQAADAPQAELTAIERAFNILGLLQCLVWALRHRHRKWRYRLESVLGKGLFGPA